MLSMVVLPVAAGSAWRGAQQAASTCRRSKANARRERLRRDVTHHRIREARRWFEQLAEGGTTTMPFDPTFCRRPSAPASTASAYRMVNTTPPEDWPSPR